MLYVGQAKVIGPLIGIDGDAVAAAKIRAIDQQTAHADSRILLNVIFWGRSITATNPPPPPR
jgi:hypothetical protein